MQAERLHLAWKIKTIDNIRADSGTNQAIFSVHFTVPITIKLKPDLLLLT